MSADTPTTTDESTPTTQAERKAAVPYGKLDLVHDADDTRGSDSPILCLGVLGKPISEKTTNVDDKTVYEFNRGYPKQDPTVVAVFISTLDDWFGSRWYNWDATRISKEMSQDDVHAKTYEYPASRLDPLGKTKNEFVTERKTTAMQEFDRTRLGRSR